MSHPQQFFLTPNAGELHQQRIGQIVPWSFCYPYAEVEPAELIAIDLQYLVGDYARVEEAECCGMPRSVKYDGRINAFVCSECAKLIRECYDCGCGWLEYGSGCPCCGKKCLDGGAGDAHGS